MSNNGSAASDFMDTVKAFTKSSAKATVRYFKGLPSRFVRFVRRKVNEIRNRPPRKDINKVYVLVGYTTKAQVDAKFNAERHMIILRRGLLALIFLLLLFISVNRFTEMINYGELSQMFGVDSMSDFLKNDSFSSNKPVTETEIAGQLTSPTSTVSDTTL
ncbi:MAG: hypothetical protein IIU27_04125 [Clostridiales bacterium]|nr:hypothetical protein [Clostridiales bacterium]